MSGYRRLAVCCAAVASAVVCLGQSTEVEKQADRAFAKNDCTAASALYRDALTSAKAANDRAKVALFDRRIGICDYRTADMEGAAAAYREGLDAARSAGDADLEIENTHGLSLALEHLGQLDEALEFANREQELAGKSSRLLFRERALYQMALVEGALGRVAQAQQHLEEMLRMTRDAKDADGTSRAEEGLAILMSNIGNYDEAVRLEEEQIRQYPNATGDDLARMYVNLGIAQKPQGHIREAERSYEIAAKAAADSKNWRVRSAIALDLGALRLVQGQYAAAEELLRDALKIVEQAKEPAFVAEARTGIAQCLLGRQRLDEASAMIAEAIAAPRQLNPSLLINANLALGDIRRAQKRPNEAIAAYEEAANQVETLRIAAPGDVKSLQALLDSSKAVYRNLIDMLIAKGDTDRALYWVERSKARVLNDILLRGGVQELSAMTAAERRSETRLYSAVFQAAPGTSEAREAAEQLDIFRRQLYAAHPELALQRADFSPAGVGQWRSLLTGDRAALLEFVVLPKGTALFVVRKDRVYAFRLAADEKSLETRVRRFRQQLASRDVTESALAQELGVSLMGPAFRQALANTTDWVISPDGPLWEAPFEALKDNTGQRLVNGHAISYTPSLTALLAVRERATARGGAQLRLFALANPSLADAEKEAREIAALFPAQTTEVATGTRANADVFVREAPRADLVHIASHAEFNAASPLYSWLRLGPEGPGETRLTAAELLRVPLKARVAVLSACETGRGGSGEGEGWMGLGWALTGAGASASVLSHWKVDSAATAFLMVRFHTELKNGQTPAAALRAALLATMKQPGFAHPFYWASFGVFGDGHGQD